MTEHDDNGHDPATIYLLPECVSPAGEGRCWSTDAIDCGLDECPAECTEYIRADRVSGLRSALQRALPEIRRWRDVGHHTGEDKARLGELIADCEAALEESG